jgi:hypothetical protein
MKMDWIDNAIKANQVFESKAIELCDYIMEECQESVKKHKSSQLLSSFCQYVRKVDRLAKMIGTEKNHLLKTRILKMMKFEV